MAGSCAEPLEPLLSVPQHIMQELQAHFGEEDSPEDFCEIKRKTSVTSRRKSRRSMNFTPEKILLLSNTVNESPHESSSTPVDHVTVNESTCESSSAPVDHVTADCQMEEEPLPYQLVGSHQVQSQDAEVEPDVYNQPTERKKYKRRRRSADFEIIQNIQTNLSPDIEIEGLDELQKLPGTRKSRRIKRQSIEMCRTAVLPSYSSCDSPLTTDSPLSSVTNSPVTVEATTPESIWSFVSHGHNCDRTTAHPDVSEVKSGSEETISPGKICNPEPVTPKDKNCDSTKHKNSDSNGRKTSSKSRKSKDKSNVTLSRGRRKKKATEPDLEDIYKNKLWRSQMPKEASWQTIYEQPRESKKGDMELCSSKRFRRALNYENFYTQQKLKRRRQKAKALGYKPLSAKREALAMVALDVRLENLDTFVKTVAGSEADSEDTAGFHGCSSHEKNNNVDAEPYETDTETLQTFNSSHVNKKNPSDDLVQPECLPLATGIGPN